jgi:hypothetical protein
MAVRPLARRQCDVSQFRCVASSSEQIAAIREREPFSRVGSVSSTGDINMRWKFRPSGHDPRQIDLLAVLAILVLIVAVDHYGTEHPKNHLTSSIIEPSQTVRW